MTPPLAGFGDIEHCSATMVMTPITTPIEYIPEAFDGVCVDWKFIISQVYQYSFVMLNHFMLYNPSYWCVTIVFICHDYRPATDERCNNLHDICAR